MNFGPLASETESFDIMDRALELGINFFDTADVYGWEMGEGITEKILGRWFSRRRRTPRKSRTGHQSIWTYGRMAKSIPSLRVTYQTRHAKTVSVGLQTDYIDLYQMHHVDRNVLPWEEIWQAMEQLYQEGKILYVGSSNFGGWHLVPSSRNGQATPFS